jgi:hypothetical protein
MSVQFFSTRQKINIKSEKLFSLIRFTEMGTKQINVSDIFEQSTCSICGCCEINQYFDINDNFVEYFGVYFSFREIISDSLNLQVILI